MIAYVAGSGAAGVPLIWNLPLVATLGVVFFGYANFVLSGYFKDISADKATGYNTLPVVFGLKVSAVVCDLFAFFALLACGFALSPMVIPRGSYEIQWWPLVFAAAGLFLSVRAQILLHAVRSENGAHRAIALVVHSYILLLSSIAVSQKPGWGLALAICYCGYILTMRSRPVRQQI
jgi:4-hydroxybenzoate polyprenyltransferase